MTTLSSLSKALMIKPVVEKAGWGRRTVGVAFLGDSVWIYRERVFSPCKRVLGICCKWLLFLFRIHKDVKLIRVNSMLAVMTLNVGYFLSVLAGLFFGELVLGRYTASDDGLH